MEQGGGIIAETSFTIPRISGSGTVTGKKNVDFSTVIPNDYQKMTIDNFIVCWTSTNIGNYQGTGYTSTSWWSGSVAKTSYDASTGILVITGTRTRGAAKSDFMDASGKVYVV